MAFNPPDHDKNEYFVRAYNQFGEDSLISSKVGIEENLLIIAYSENQELYSPGLDRIDPIGDDCIQIESFPERPCFPGNPDPGPDPDPVETEEGINIARIKTKGIQNGLFDGDLELRIEIKQSLAEFNAPASLGILDLSSLLNIEVNPYYLFNQTIPHDAGHWYWYWYEFRFRNSNKWTQINYKRKWADRQTYIDLSGIFGDIELAIYNNRFTLKITEHDALTPMKYITMKIIIFLPILMGMSEN